MPKKTSSPAAAPPGDAQEWVVIGEVVAAFGVHGEVKVRPLTDFPERFAHTSTVFLGDEHKRAVVEAARQHGRLVVLRLEGVVDVSAAERLRGTRLWIPAEELLPLPEGRYYLHDLVGLRVRHINGTDLGIVADVLTGAGNDLLVIRNATTGEERLLPAVKEFVKAVDVAGGELTVAPIPGLLDDGSEDAEDADRN
jgi:16S rRNA processing protein RimM